MGGVSSTTKGQQLWTKMEEEEEEEEEQEEEEEEEYEKEEPRWTTMAEETHSN